MFNQECAGVEEGGGSGEGNSQAAAISLRLERRTGKAPSGTCLSQAGYSLVVGGSRHGPWEDSG